MAATIDWGAKTIWVPQADLTFISGMTYSHDTDAFRLDLKNQEDDVLGGMAYPDTHEHTTTKTIAGTTYARFIEIINGYTVEYEDGMYAVRLDGSNNNIFQDGVIVRNQVSVISNNSAGLVVVAAVESSADIAAAVWGEATADEIGAGTRGLEASETHQAADQAATQRYT